MRDNAAMSDDSQLFVPESFIAVYRAPGRLKPSLPREALAERYECCEDMAQSLLDAVTQAQARQDLPEEAVLEGVAQSLTLPPLALPPLEARWVACRIAELLQWPMPAPPQAGDNRLD